MEITKELIKKVARQSKLELADDEVEKLIPQLKEILDIFSKLDKLDTANVEPLFHPIEIKNITREDKIENSISNEEALSQTPHKKNNYFLGPKAI